MISLKKVSLYIAKLCVFFAVCILLGLIVLVLMFAPATNPSFLVKSLFRGNNQSDLEGFARLTSAVCGDDAPALKIYETLEKPQKDAEFKRAGLSAPEVIKFKTADGVGLEGWYFKGSGPDTALVSYNAFGKRLPLLCGLVKMLHDCGLSVLLFDYRGLNQDSVKVSAQTAYQDGQAAYDYLVNTKKVDPAHLILIGRDLGSYVSVKIAADHNCKALVLENPWSTVKDSMEATPGAFAMRLVPDWLYTDDCLSNLHLIKKDHPPVLVVAQNPEATSSDKFLAGITPPKSFLFVDEYLPSSLCPDLKESGADYAKRLKDIIAGVPMTEGAKSSVNWLNSYSDALAKAKSDKKPLLVDIGAPWCPACRQMDAITYVEPQVASKINSDFIAVKLDAQNEAAGKLASQYEFVGIPTALFFDADGKFKKKVVGFVSPAEFYRKLDSVK